MSNIVLGSATQQNLLALQQASTASLTTTTSEPARHRHDAASISATDDAVKYFQAQSLTSRASDLSTRKDAIDQGIQSLTAATNGINSVISILQQREGIVNGASTQTASYSALRPPPSSIPWRQQLRHVAGNDSELSGPSTSSIRRRRTSRLQFSIASTSKLKITGQNLLFSKLVTGGVRRLRRFVGTKGSKAATGLAISASSRSRR